MDIVALSHHSINDRPSIYISLWCDDGVVSVDMIDCYLYNINQMWVFSEKDMPGIVRKGDLRVCVCVFGHTYAYNTYSAPDFVCVHTCVCASTCTCMWYLVCVIGGH